MKLVWTQAQIDRFRQRWLRLKSNYGLTTAEMSEGMGLSVYRIRRIERGGYAPSDKEVIGFGQYEKRIKEGKERERALQWVPGKEI